MTHEQNQHEEQHASLPATPTEAARSGFSQAPRRPWLGYLVVALLSIAASAGGTALALRGRSLTPDPAGENGAAATAGQHGGHATGAERPAKPEGAGDKAVYLTAQRRQLIGVRTAPVEHRALETTIRTVGVLAYDETRVAEIHTKIAGWVERTWVDYVGKPVRKGQPLLSVYSPELVSTQKEYLLAIRAGRQLQDSGFAETREGATGLVNAARERLQLWDISDAQIRELEKSQQPRRTLTLYSPFDGIVLERNTFPGQYIMPETSTFKVADLSTIWVFGQIFEYELPLVKLGQMAEIQFPYGQSNRALSGRITYIYPEIDPATRRVKVRIEFRNPGFQLKPDTYVTVLIRTAAGEQLAIPKEAVIDNGDRRYAIVALGNGYFEPREIQVAAPVDQYYPVLKGLGHGDVVVTSAQFLIDSETNLQAAMRAMAATMPGMEMEGMDMGEGGEKGHEGMQMPEQPKKPGGDEGMPMPEQKKPGGHEGMPMPEQKKPGGDEGMPMPEQKKPGGHEGMPMPEQKKPGGHEGMSMPEQKKPGGHEGMSMPASPKKPKPVPPSPEGR